MYFPFGIRQCKSRKNTDSKSDNSIIETQDYLGKQKPQDEDKTNPATCSVRVPRSLSYFDIFRCLRIMDSHQRSGETYAGI